MLDSAYYTFAGIAALFLTVLCFVGQPARAASIPTLVTWSVFPPILWYQSFTRAVKLAVEQKFVNGALSLTLTCVMLTIFFGIMGTAMHWPNGGWIVAALWWLVPAAAWLVHQWK